MTSSPTILDSDFRYIDKKGNLMRTRTELTIAQMLSFLDEDYEYDYKLSLKNGSSVTVDFKTKKGLIEIIDNEEDIKKLANLVRIEISDEEAEKLTPEIDSVLGYVGQIKNATGDTEKTVHKLHNVLRDDVVVNKEGEYTESLLEAAPSREGDYVKVKKIL